MHRTVPKPPRVHFAPPRPPDYDVVTVHHIEKFLTLHSAIHVGPLPARQPRNAADLYITARSYAVLPLKPFPMPKIDVNLVAEILKKNQLDPKLLRQVIEEMNLAAQPEGPDGDKPPAVKKQFVVLASDPDNRLPKHDFVAWVLQIPEDESVATTQDRIFRGAYDYNASKKGRLYPAKTVGEALENVPAKFFKEAEIWVKSKVPVLVLKTDNQIPKE